MSETLVSRMMSSSALVWKVEKIVTYGMKKALSRKPGQHQTATTSVAWHATKAVSLFSQGKRMTAELRRYWKRTNGRLQQIVIANSSQGH